MFRLFRPLINRRLEKALTDLLEAEDAVLLLESVEFMHGVPVKEDQYYIAARNRLTRARIRVSLLQAIGGRDVR
jgi:hypothetical protein